MTIRGRPRPTSIEKLLVVKEHDAIAPARLSPILIPPWSVMP